MQLITRCLSVITALCFVVGCEQSSSSTPPLNSALVSLYSSAVSVSDIQGAVVPCGAGYAHPTVCCSAGPGQSVMCVGTPADAFRACDEGAFAYPDNRLCCPLDGRTDCIEGSSSSADGSTGTCSYPCAPGGYPPSKLAAPGGTPLCTTDTYSDPAQDCYYCCLDLPATGSSCTSNMCTCPGSNPGCTCGPTCGSCPSGWAAPREGQLDLCCQTTQGGTQQECFSQSILVQ